MAMVSFACEGTRFHYCVDGVCIHDGHVLLCRAGEAEYWFTPGGRVELGETSQAALLREMQEELGEDVSVGRLLWVVENLFVLGAEPTHELALMYAITLPQSSSFLDLAHERVTEDAGMILTLRWFPLATLPAVELRPAFLRTAFQQLPEQITHVVCDERGGPVRG
jgi:ADP-ribose pyrophosphatase YjhB (NUDIX family)